MALTAGKNKNSFGVEVPWSKNETMQSNSIRSMKLFTEWDVENAAPNCIPRSCCLRVNRLQVFKPLEVDLKALCICVAMQGSRRSLRSDQIPVQPSGVVDVELDLVFTLQYPHFLKRRENRLQIMLQRRKKYKTRTILGYKTLAVGNVNMAQVLQGWYSHQLHLFTKDSKSPAATLNIISLSSDPIDREIQDQRITIASMSEQLNSSDEEGSDSSDSDGDDSAGDMDHPRMPSRTFKQKFIRRLFKRLKVADADLGDVQKELQDAADGMNDDEFLFDEDDDDDSENDNDLLDDNLSIASIQKPGLRPYFDHCKSQTTLNQSTLTHEEANELSEAITAAANLSANSNDANDDVKEINNIENKSDTKVFLDDHSSIGQSSTDQSYLLKKNTPRSLSFREKKAEKYQLKRKASADAKYFIKDSLASNFNNQLSAVLGNDDKIPEYILLVNTVDELGQNLALKLMSRIDPIICTSGSSDVQAIITAVANKFQKFCNRHSVSPPSLGIAVLGRESYLRDVLKGFVEQFSTKRQEHQNFVKFLVIPIGAHKVANYIAHVDKTYCNLFMDSFWSSLFEQAILSDTDMKEVESRIRYYIENSDIIHSIPIAEALVTCKQPNGESNQTFIPFITEVRIGNTETTNHELCDGDAYSINSNLVMKETNGEKQHDKNHDKSSRDTPSVSPRIENGSDTKSASVKQATDIITEKQDLLVDYWPLPNPLITLPNKKEEKKEGNKLSIKSTFKSLCVSRIPSEDNEDMSGLLFHASMKSRNKGVKRLMTKRDKDSESKSSMSVVVTKIVCTTRSSSQTFNVFIDGNEWTNVKFFSLSSQWPTHIKQFPIAMFLNYGYSDST